MQNYFYILHRRSKHAILKENFIWLHAPGLLRYAVRDQTLGEVEVSHEIYKGIKS